MPTCAVNNKFKVPQNSNYSGKYDFERRCDYKQENWEKDQTYEGEFFNDVIHGQGNYTWNNSGIYGGDFYSSSKEGYGVVSFPNNSLFEGLFIKNQPFGPGILSHGDGYRDSGFWVGRKLVRLSRAVDLIVPRLASTSAARRKLLQFQLPVQLNEIRDDSDAEIRKSFFLFDYVRFPYSKLIYDPRSFFFDKFLFDSTYLKNANDVPANFKESWGQNLSEGENHSESEEEEVNLERRPPSHCLCPNDVFVMKYKEGDEEDHCDEKSVGKPQEIGYLGGYSKREKSKDAGGGEIDENLADSKQILEDLDEVDKEKGEEKSDKIKSWNRSEICKELVKQILRFQPFEGKVSFNIEKLMTGAKQAIMRKTGKKEKKCLQFLELCALGPTFAVKEYLCSNEISEELMDSRGNNSLMFAAAMDQHDIIDLLLDYGVDVNAFNDESLTPLNLCLLRRLAQTYNVSDWEVAFLPPGDVVETSGEDLSIDYGRSDESLDALVGGPISVQDKKVPISEEESFTRKWDKSSWKKPSLYSDANKDLSILSQITIINVKKKLGSSSQKATSVDEFSTIPSGKTLTPKVGTSTSPSKSLKAGASEHHVKIEKYLFDLSPAPNPILQDNKKQKVTVKLKKNNSSGSLIDEEESAVVLTEKIKEIDKTIEKLLQRGADPNISTMPRPSIHLGIFTKDLRIVYNLLAYGASPDSRLHQNEGLLTPLHVVALLKPAKVYVEMCHMLLKHGANPEVETTPEFSTYEEEKSLLNSSRGRTPLHLLCMRPDFENANLQRFLIKIGIMLANAGDKENFYNGHSYLTLAMLCGNISLLRALLESKYFDPNVILGEDLGTPLHVLVSTLLQMRTEYDKSLKMCDLLIAAGANPLKKFEAPDHLLGTCIDYGYREIEREKMNRKHNVDDKSKTGSKAKKQEERDHLKDHVRVVEYLKQAVLDMVRINRRRGSISSKARNSLIKEQEKRGKDRGTERGSSIRILPSPGETLKPRKGIRKNTEEDVPYEISPDEKSKHKKGGRKNKEDSGDLDETKHKKKNVKNKKERSRDEAYGSGKRNFKEKSPKRLKEREHPSKKGKESERRKNADDRISKKPRGPRSSDKERKTLEGKQISNKRKKGETKQPWGKSKKVNAIEELKAQRKHLIKLEMDGFGRKGKTDLYQELKKNSKRLRKPFLAKHFADINSEMVPGKLRHFFRNMFGNCINFDINEFLLPYVVLRDGDLYYRFDGKATGRKEQYSLV